MIIDAKGIYYRQLNEMIKEAVEAGETDIVLQNVNGQRYIGTNLGRPVNITIHGVPGNDLGAFMDGPTIVVHGNGQDAIGNTMNSGKIVVHGHAGDVLGYGMRGGKLFIRGNVGYRVGIHMKEYKKQVPVLIVGGTAGAFLGEYMAGGCLIVLGLNTREGEPLAGDYLGTGMHGGVIYLRGQVDRERLGKEVAVFDVDEDDRKLLEKHLSEYCSDLGLSLDEVMSRPFVKLLPVSSRPYGRLYVY